MADVSVSLDLDAQQLYSELAQVQSHFATFAAKTVSEGEQASRGFVSGFGRGFGSLGTNIVQGLAAAGIGNELRTIVEKFSQIEDVGVRFGVPVEGLQRIANAAEKMGVPLEGVAKSFRFLELARDKALAGNEQFVKSFTDAGVSMEQLKSIRIEDLFVQVGGHAINAVEGVKLFGRAFADIRPVAEGLAQGTLKFGEALSAIDVKRIKDAEDAFKSLHQEVDILAGKTIATFAGNFQASIGELVLNSKAGIEEIKGVFSAIGAVARGEFNALADYFSGVGKAIKLALQGQFGGAADALKEGIKQGVEDSKKGIQDAAKEIGVHDAAAKDLHQAAIDFKKEALTPAGDIKPRPIPAEEESAAKQKEEEKDREKAADEREKNILKLSGVKEGRGTGTGTGEGVGTAGGAVTPTTLQQEIAKTEQGISALQSPSERIDDYHAKQQAATDKYYADQKKATEEYNKQQRVEHPELDAGAERRTQLEALQSRLSVLKEGAEAGAKVQEIKSAPIEELLREIKENTKDATANK